LLSFAN